ncbi:MAG: ROK family protein [Planctomycetes bacterium]|nr:ROK family protein [Planctomycetota bacterium]
MRTVLAGDLGGTKCRFALVSEDYGVHRVQHVPTVREREPFLRSLEQALATIVADLPPGCEPPLACGFGTAGVVPRDGRSIDRAPNLPLDGFPLADFCERQFGVPTTLLNDGRASAWGEFLRGHAAGLDPLLCLLFGTGIGIGLIVDGKPFAGGNNAAGEIGHTTFVPDGRLCPCGGKGHFEAYCGGRAITEQGEARLGPGPNGGRWTVGAIAKAAAGAGSTAAAARAILAEAEAAACALVANACTLLNPRAVVLGGGVLSGWPELEARIVTHVRAATSPMIHRDLRFVPTLGGSDAILWGASAATGKLFAAG